MKATIHTYKKLYLFVYMHLHTYIPLHIQRVCSALYLIISPPFPQLLQQSYNVSMYHTQYKPNPTLYSLNIPIHSSNIIIFPTLYSTSLNVYILVCSLVLHPRKSKERKRNIARYLYTFYMQLYDKRMYISALYCRRQRFYENSYDYLRQRFYIL